MRKSRIWLLGLSLALLVAFSVMLFMCGVGDSVPFHFKLTDKSGTENISCWENEAGEYYVFLPSFAKMNDLEIEADTDTTVKIDGKETSDGMSCESFCTDKKLKLEYSSFARKVTKNITFVKSEKLPTLYISTQSGNMDYINDKKGNKESGSYKIYTTDGNVDASGRLEAVGGRGNSTWNYFDKKPYNLTLANQENLLGMGSAKKWILLSNAIDPSNMRNKIVYDFAKEIGLMSPECEWVDLYLNGEYAGLYLLCRRNDTYFTDDNSSVKESFLVSLEAEDRLKSVKTPYVSTKENQALRIHSATMEKEKITEIWQTAENAIMAENGVDTATNKHWRELIDTESWVRKYLIEEVFGNLDACYLSQYFYCGKDMNNTKIFAGPVWDYDMTMGNKDNWSLGSSDIMVANRLEVSSGEITPWFYKLYNDGEFYSQIIKTYETEFLPLLSDFLDRKIAEYEKHIICSDAIDRIRWSQYRSENFDYEVGYVRDYMNNRLEFLNNIWLNGKEYVTLKFDSGSGHYGYWKIQTGKTVAFLPILKENVYDKFIGWYYSNTNEPFDISKPICEDTEIYAKWQDSSHKKTEQVIKLIPIAVIAVLFIILFVIEVKRIKRKG